MEHVMLLLFLGVALYMFVESYSFSDRAAAFPRFTAGATIVGTLLLLFRSYLPGPLKHLVTDSGGAYDDVVDEELEDAEEELDLEQPEPEVRIVELFGYSIHGAQFTAVLTALFVVVSYLIGMLWASPLFVAIYLAVLGRSTVSIVGLSLLAFVAAFSFWHLLGIGIGGGVLVDLEWVLDALVFVYFEPLVSIVLPGDLT